MATVLKNMGCPPVLLNSVEDHIHILFGLSRTVALCKVVEAVKKSSSKWIKTQHVALSRFSWQAGYGAFSISQSKLDRVLAYVEQQEKHHKKRSYQDEFRELCRKHKIEIDERYVWD